MGESENDNQLFELVVLARAIFLMMKYQIC